MPSPNDYFTSEEVFAKHEEAIHELRHEVDQFKQLVVELKELLIDSVMAIQKKVGIDNSPDAASLDYRIGKLEEKNELSNV